MKKRNVMAVIGALALGAFLLLPATRLPAGEKMEMGEHMDMGKMISSAKTAADHEALAKEYDSEAEAAKAKAVEHRKMGESYKKLGGALIGKWHLDEHCERIARSYDEAAKQSEALAKAHRDMAKAAK